MCFHCENGNPHCHIPTEYRWIDNCGVCGTCFKGLAPSQITGDSPHWCINRYILISRERPTRSSEERALREKLREVADQLERWAVESSLGGWSTHQVEPMKEEAACIYEMLGRIK